MVGHRSNHLLACGIHSDVGVVHVAGAEHNSSHDGRSGEVGVHNHVHNMAEVHSPCNHGNVEVVDDSHSVGCIHHSSLELVSSVASLQK